MMESNEIVNRLRNADPIERASAAFDEARSNQHEVRRQLQAAMVREDRPPEPKRKYRPRVAFVALGTVSLAAAIGVGLFGRFADEPWLERFAALAVAEASEAENTHATIEGADLVTFIDDPPFSVRVPYREEVNLRTDGSARVVRTQRALEFPGPRDQERFKASGSSFSSDPSESHTETFKSDDYPSWGEPGLPAADKLPNDGEALDGILERAAARNSDVPAPAGKFELATIILEQPGVDARVREELFYVVAAIPGVEELGEVTDINGRTGQGIALRSSYSGVPTEYRMIVDPETAQVFAFEVHLLDRVDFMDGALRSYRILAD